jgi:hypothetical protein
MKTNINTITPGHAIGRLLLGIGVYLGFLLSQAYCQTTITGTLTDATGAPMTCVVTAHPLSVAGFAPTDIVYTAVAGDFSGSLGGYGDGNANITRHAALLLAPGVYRASLKCATALVFSWASYIWTVPTGTVTIQHLLGGS